MMNNSFEEFIDNYFKTLEINEVTKAMKYSMDGGKRIRPLIIFSILKGYGIEESVGYSCALALEMIQTYSLIHDDLPAMDDDDLRRGKPSCHKAFGEDVAILAGDALLTHSFGVIADSNYSNDIKAKMISSLSAYSGLNGMIKGQLLDVKESVTKDAKGLELIQDNKTGGLFKIACLFASYIAQDDNTEIFTQLGSRIGIIFQNQDDLFDVTKSQAEVGKSLSQKDIDKFTALSVYSVDELKDKLDNDFNELNTLLDRIDFNSSYLKELVQKIKER